MAPPDSYTGRSGGKYLYMKTDVLAPIICRLNKLHDSDKIVLLKRAGSIKTRQDLLTIMSELLE